MYAVTINEHGGPEVLDYVEVPDPELGPGQVLVRTTAVGVNYIDTYQREGAYPVPLPCVMGSEAAGVVVDAPPAPEAGEADGARGYHPRIGDRVAWCQVPGSYAELVAAPTSALVPVPEGIDDEVAASMLLQGLTAHYLVNDSHRARSGQWVLVHAAAGGVGRLLVQMARRAGLRVVATASTAQKRELARAAGAEEVLDYAQADAEHVRELTGGGVATVFDGVGAPTFDAGLDSLLPRGHMVLFGAAGGPVPPLDPQRLNSAGSLFLTRPTLAHHIADRAELLRRAGDVTGAILAGDLDLEVGARFPLARAGDAHRALQSRETTGSVVLLPGR